MIFNGITNASSSQSHGLQFFGILGNALATNGWTVQGSRPGWSRSNDTNGFTNLTSLLFSGNTTSTTAFGFAPYKISIELDQPTIIRQFGMRCNTFNNPRDFVFQGSTNGITWNTLVSFVAVPAGLWSTAQPAYDPVTGYTKADVPTGLQAAYKHYRFSCTSFNGASLEIIKFAMFSSTINGQTPIVGELPVDGTVFKSTLNLSGANPPVIAAAYVGHKFDDDESIVIATKQNPVFGQSPAQSSGLSPFRYIPIKRNSPITYGVVCHPTHIIASYEQNGFQHSIYIGHMQPSVDYSQWSYPFYMGVPATTEFQDINDNRLSAYWFPGVSTSFTNSHYIINELDAVQPVTNRNTSATALPINLSLAPATSAYVDHYVNDLTSGGGQRYNRSFRGRDFLMPLHICSRTPNQFNYARLYSSFYVNGYHNTNLWSFGDLITDDLGNLFNPVPESIHTNRPTAEYTDYQRSTMYCAIAQNYA